MVCYIATQFYSLIYHSPYTSLQLSLPCLIAVLPIESHTIQPNCLPNQKLEGKIQQITQTQSNTHNHSDKPTPASPTQKMNERCPRDPLSNIEPKPLSKGKREFDSFTQRRNIIPNTINHILAFVQRKSKSQHLVQKIFQKHSQVGCTTQRFYCYQGYLKQKLHLHVNKDTLHTISNQLELSEGIFSVEEQLFYNRITRILINYYIRQMAKLKILSSGRVKCTSKIDHLRAHRTLRHYLVGNYDQV